MSSKFAIALPAFILALAVSVAPAAASAGSGLPAIDSQGQPLPSLAPMLERVMPAVVNVSTVSHIRVQDNPLLQDPFFRFFFDTPEQRPREREAQSLGSGVIVDAEHGYVLTNNHVVDKADEIRVILMDGRQLTAEVVGADPEADIAVIKIPAEKLTAIQLADSDQLRVGDFVAAIGNPFGLGQTVTSGIVSALGRSGLGIEGYEDFIQTDASINPGNSGGALVNLRGELVGVNTAIIAPGGGNIGIGFAIPSNMAHEIMTQLVQYGEVRRGQLGAVVQDLTPELAQAFGVEGVTQGAIVVRVEENTAAAKAGLKTGDIVVSVNGEKVTKASDLRNRIGMLRVGDKVTLEVLRDGKSRTLKAVVAKAQVKQVKGETLNPRLTGALFADIDERSPLYGRVKGVMIEDVAPGSPAAAGGLRKGDIVTSANRRDVGSTAELQAALSANGGGSVLLNIRRGDMALFVLLR